MQWFLEAVADANRKWLVTIKSVPFVIGRADDRDLKLIDNRVSRHHSEIRISGDLMWIRDLESTNGTYVNQNKVEAAQLLEPNDTISIGDHQFRVKTLSSSISLDDHETIQATHSKALHNVDLSSVAAKLKRLIRQIHLVPERLQQMVATFIKAAHDLGSLTLAEGIECAEETQACQALGFDLGQGYFFGRPAPVDSVKKSLKEPRTLRLRNSSNLSHRIEMN